MTIDIRATVSCSLGTVISGNFADNYLQANGLIRTRGEVVLSGTSTPTVGTTVTFTYTKDGTQYTLPRVLRVLSSFADPFRRTTTVQLGCLLTYLENRKPPIEDPNGRDENNVTCAVYERALLPISAAYVFEQCALALDITTDTIPLTNYFSIEEFDLTPGYIQVMSDLLQSEGYAGYLDSSEVLRFINLSDEAGTGPLLTSADIIDAGPIGTGDLPGESVVVRYRTERLLPPEELSDEEALKRSWEQEEVFGSPVEVSVTYTDANGNDQTENDVFYPYTFTATRYDIWDRKVQQITVATRSAAEVNGRWATDAASQSRSWNAPAARTTVEEFMYRIPAPYASSVDLVESASEEIDVTELKATLSAASAARTGTAASCKNDPPEGYEEILLQRTTNNISELELAGGIGIDTYISDGGTLKTFSTIANRTQSVVQVDYTTDVAGGNTKTVIKRFQNRSSTLTGQQDLAVRAEEIDTADLSNEIDSLLTIGGVLVYQGAEVVLSSQREYGLQKRPNAAARTSNSYGKRRVTESEAELEWVMGSTSSTAVVEFSLPYAPDDRISWSEADGYSSTPSDAPQKALQYGRIQNALLLGNRNGLSLQLPPELLPKRPFDVMYVEANGLTANYRVNGSSWAFDANGIVASSDALLYGAVSATSGTSLSSSWIPLAPNTSSLPTPYTSTTGSADSETGVTYANVISPTVVLKPYTEKVKVTGLTRTGSSIAEYGYALDRGTETAAVTTRSKVVIGPKLTAAGTSFAAQGKAATFIYTKAIAAAGGSFTSTGYSAGSVRDYSIGTNAGTFTSTGQSAGLQYQRAPLPLAAGSFSLSGQNAGSFRGINMAGAAGAFSLSGEAAGQAITRAIKAGAGSISLTGQNATLEEVVSDTYWNDVILLMKGDGTNGSTTFTDLSSQNLTMSSTGTAALTTSVKKFGTASFNFNTGSAGSVQYPSSSGDEMDIGLREEFTAEFWLYVDTFTTAFSNSSTYLIFEMTGATDFSINLVSSSSNSGVAVIRAIRNFSSTGAFNHQDSVPTGQWVHVAMVRIGETEIRLFLDGVKSTSTASWPDSLNMSNFFSFGNRNGGGNGFYIDEMRVTKGVARYTADFTPPTASFPEQ